ncbi:MAG: ATP cone domain-containing protein [Kofleriaceae bacterium]
MQCPYCGEDSNVTETRVVPDGLRRRRVCNSCRRRFTTYERVGQPSLRVEKRDGSVEPFDGDKLVRSLLRVSGWRGVKDEVLRRVARDIEATLVDAGQRSVAWSDIVRAALHRLDSIDRVAARRLAANYQDEHGDLRLEGEAARPGELPQLDLPGVEDERA